ncbi:hypothetical protein DFJ73DRAFT_256070 [Zopfochytrium polystomum]|nr:hypothetical protein DFJ73DRAFT_256070 [Zopfochytrium polystomum]
MINAVVATRGNEGAEGGARAGDRNGVLLSSPTFDSAWADPGPASSVHAATVPTAPARGANHRRPPSVSKPTKAKVRTKPNGPARRSCETCRKRKIRCDGVRPTCGFCLQKMTVPCVFESSKNRVEDDLARQFEAERRRRRMFDGGNDADRPAKKRSKLTSGLNAAAATVASSISAASAAPTPLLLLEEQQVTHLLTPIPVGPAGGFGFGMRIGGEQSPATWRAAPEKLEQGEFSFNHRPSSSFAGSVPPLASPSLSVQTTPLPPKPIDWDDPDHRRPGSAPGEQRSILKNFGSINPLLRLAICAVGALTPLTSALSNDVSEWYYERALSLTVSAMDAPTIETFQSLMLLIEVASATGLRSTWWGRVRLAASLAITLNLNIDPDLLPPSELAEGTWLEKETRRRCWWAFYLVERTLADTFFQASLISNNICSVQPMCSDEVWFSPKDPASLEHLYESTRSPRANLFTFRIKLSSLWNEIAVCASPEPLYQVDIEAIRMTERRLEQELDEYRKSFPSEFSVHLNEDWIFETQDTDQYQFHSIINQFISYHGGRCHLMRRRSLVHLREVSASLAGSRLAPDEENRAALQKGLASAVAIGRLLSLLLKSPGAIQRFPIFLTLPIIQGCTMLLMADGLVPAFTSGTPAGLDASPVTGADIDPAELPKLIDSYTQLLRTLGGRNRAINNHAGVFEQFRACEWNDLEKLCNDPAKLLSVDYMGDGSEPDLDSIGPWQRRVRMLSAVAREFLSGLRAAREISSRMTPPQPPVVVPRVPGGKVSRALMASLNWADLVEQQHQQQHQPSGSRFLPSPLVAVPSTVSDAASFSSSPELFGSDGGAEAESTGSDSWFDSEAPLADNPDDGDNAMVLLDWLFSSEQSVL